MNLAQDPTPLLWASLALLLAGGGLWLWAQGQATQLAAGLPAGRVIYADDGVWQPNRETLYADEVKLAGRPDYIVEEPGGTLAPVELKSSKAPAEPRVAHIMQLAAYCVLVEAQWGIRPNRGILQYSDRAFNIPFSAELEAQLYVTLELMREDCSAGDIPRSHTNPRQCAACSVRHACEQRLM